jgi:enolase-phosphatase E1
MTRPEPAVILLDVEGTTTPISFVYDVLFPYARAHMADFLATQAATAELRADLETLARERSAEPAGSGAPAFDNAAAEHIAQAHAYLLWLMDRDRKSPALKSVQGRIWQAGYASSELKSLVFPDVPTAFARWRQQDRRIAIYSSGSVLAQQLLFAHTSYGDLTSSIDAYFDTAVGAKTQRESYTRIAASLHVDPASILFLSDATPELDAAAAAGVDVRLAVRLGNRPVSDTRFRPIRSFGEI